MPLACPVCGLHALPGICLGCEALLEHTPHGLGVVPQRIEVGEPIVAFDFRRDPLPGLGARDGRVGSTTCRGTAHGIECHVPAGRHVAFMEEPIRARDVVIALTAASSTGGFGVIARLVYFDDAEAYVLFEVQPGRARLGRRVTIGESASTSELVPWTSCTTAAVNRIELRVQGPDLHAYVNGAAVFVAHDPVLGIGHVGVLVSHGDAAAGPAVITLVDLHVALTRA